MSCRAARVARARETWLLLLRSCTCSRLMRGPSSDLRHALQHRVGSAGIELLHARSLSMTK
eukprot:2983206-Heterocapsa_arctica.AAC.1